MRLYRKSALAALAFFAAAGAFAQDKDANYREADDGVRPDAAAWSTLEQKLYASWASRDVHYVKTAVPQLKLKTDTVVYAWRGERASAAAVLFSPTATREIALRLSDWHKEGCTIPAIQGWARFQRYVLTDAFKSCGSHPTDLKPYLVPDVIDTDTPLAIEAQTTRPIWVTLEVPREAEAGEYALTLDILDADTEQVLEQLNLRVRVQDNTLPRPEEQAFHLDFWQQPYSVSRYYGVERWSDEHFQLLRPYMELLARAGQSVVSAILFYEPWGDQSHDKFSPMVQTTKRADGTWAYDYTVFDRWVEFMASCGISKQIDCFSMVPWDMTFRYYDEAAGRDVDLKTTTSAADYKALWTSFLQSFAAHLREKGWFDKTLIAMDERGLNNMLDAYAVAQEAVPGLRMALAGNYHAELTDKLADYCIAFGQQFSQAELKARRAKGWYSTVYTCCTEKQPNIFTNSLPAEAAYLPLFAIANDFDGYLHWSWLNWTDNPLTDSRYRLFSPGDTYVVYPGPRSSVRWERFIEGVQQAEKVRLLRAEYTEGENAEALQKLNEAVEVFRSGVIDYYHPAARSVSYLESVLNGAPEPPAEKPEDYCEVVLAEDKRDVAIEKRWLTKASTTGCNVNLDYSADGPSVAGYVLTPAGITVEPGQSFRLRTTTAQNDDDLRYCRALLVADWNCDSIFDTTGTEVIARVGNANTANENLLTRTFVVRVPQNATPGDTRLRLCYADAWTNEPMPCGELYKGFAIDIPMVISEPDTPVRAIAAAGTKWDSGVLRLDQPARLYVYNTAGALLDYTALTQAYSTHGYLRGTYILLAAWPDGRRQQMKFVR